MQAGPLFIVIAAVACFAGHAVIASGQAPTHKHYETPPNEKVEPGKPLAPRLQNLGVHTFRVTSNPRAQLFIHQGFNHAEAARAFAEAARLDPKCAMAYWARRS